MGVRPPVSYQEWTAFLKRLAEGDVPENVLQLLEQGTLPEGAYVTERFQQRVVETVDTMLRRSIRRFNRQLSGALEDGDTGSAEVLCIRLKKELDLCWFFQRMHFLDAAFLAELEKALKGQIRLFWKNEIREIRRVNDLAGRPDLEEMLYSMKRFAREYGE